MTTMTTVRVTAVDRQLLADAAFSPHEEDLVTDNSYNPCLTTIGRNLAAVAGYLEDGVDPERVAAHLRKLASILTDRTVAEEWAAKRTDVEYRTVPFHVTKLG